MITVAELLTQDAARGIDGHDPVIAIGGRAYTTAGGVAYELQALNELVSRPAVAARPALMSRSR